MSMCVMALFVFWFSILHVRLTSLFKLIFHANRTEATFNITMSGHLIGLPVDEIWNRNSNKYASTLFHILSRVLPFDGPTNFMCRWQVHWRLIHVNNNLFLFAVVSLLGHFFYVSLCDCYFRFLISCSLDFVLLCLLHGIEIGLKSDKRIDLFFSLWKMHLSIVFVLFVSRCLCFSFSFSEKRLNCKISLEIPETLLHVFLFSRCWSNTELLYLNSHI